MAWDSSHMESKAGPARNSCAVVTPNQNPWTKSKHKDRKKKFGKKKLTNATQNINAITTYAIVHCTACLKGEEVLLLALAAKRL